MGAELMSADVNAMSVLGRELLLVETGGGEIHVAAVSTEEDRRAAVNVDRTDPSEPPEVIPGYDQAALHHERWSPKALCGRRWVEMAAGEGGAFRRFQEVELAPTCRSCLRVVDTWSRNLTLLSGWSSSRPWRPTRWTRSVRRGSWESRPSTSRRCGGRSARCFEVGGSVRRPITSMVSST